MKQICIIRSPFCLQKGEVGSRGGVLPSLMLAIIFFLPTPQTLAHEIRPAYLQITQQSDSSYRVLWKIPALNGMIPRITPVLPMGFELEEESVQQLPDALIRVYRGSYMESLAGKSVQIDKLQTTLIDVLVQISLMDGTSYSLLLQPDQPIALIPIEPEAKQVLKLYTWLGIKHILIGIDHLLFVLGLIMIVSGVGNLFRTITAFTIAHSLTLGVAALDLFRLPQAPVEAVIALSILFLAKEYLELRQGRQNLTSRYPWVVAFAFGLLHGFGFAGALAEIGLPQAEIPLALFSFNVGVELGQIMFVAGIYAVLWGFQKLELQLKSWMYKIPPYLIGSIAAFWLIERVLGF